MDVVEGLKNILTAIGARLRGLNRTWLIGGGAFIVLLGAWMMFGGKEDEDPYRTAPIDRGAITRVVSATGTLQPLVSVNVGSTVSGPVLSVEADFNSRVRAGQVLARLEPTTFEQRITQAQANLSSAQAQYAVANADFTRYQRLEAAGFASEQLMSQQRAARDSARAVVSQANASLAAARTDLERSIIRSPIDGLVVDRQVNPGQSVAASFQAPTLFVIAQDLSRLQANITVDEADIGEVRQGMPVRFTVDAFPDAEFEGRVSQVRQQGVDTNGVISYTVVVESENPGGRLLPGMTANAEIIIEQTEDVMRLPNAALRFRPADPEIAARGQAMAAEATGGGAPQGGGQGGGERRQREGGGGQGGGGQGGGGRGIAQLAETLHLTEAQQVQAREAMQAEMASAGGRMGDMQQAERRAFFRRAREAAIARIEPSLSTEQRQLLAQMRSGGMGEPREVRRQAVAWVLRNGKPTPVAIEIGVADDGHTALVGGDLREGDEVIIGGGPRAEGAGQQQQQGPMGGGPRVRGV
jgi:HlyD family secretion protein